MQQPVQHEQSSTRSVSRWSRIGFVVVTGLFLAATAFQVFLAGMSIFVSGTWWQAHMLSGSLIEILPILLIVLAFVGRLPRTYALAGVLLLGLFFLQYAFIEISANSGVRWFAAFHPVNALVMLAVGLVLFQRARRIV